MCEAEFENTKQIIEAEQEAPLSPADEIVVKGLFYFGQGVKLKNRLELEQKQQKRQASVVQAIKDFFSGQKQSKKHRVGKKKIAEKRGFFGEL